MDPLYFYQLEEPIDMFYGMIPLDYHVHCEQDWFKEALALEECAYQFLAAIPGYWDDDHRWTHVGFLPMGNDSATVPFLVIKQGNNGLTAVISPVEFPWLGK